MKKVSTQFRTAGKQEGILQTLRQQIIDGVLAPGEQLLPRRQLERQFQVSPPTLQRAVDQLARDGFVTCLQGRGTYVAENPPHLSNYALVFPVCPNTGEWSRLYGALAGEAVRIERTQARTVGLFYDVAGHSDDEDYQKLLRETRARRVAGVIFATPPESLVGMPLLEEPGTPLVAVMSQALAASMPHVAAISLDLDSFITKAMDYFVARGRRRVAVLMLPQGEPIVSRIDAAARQRGLMTRRRWYQSVQREFSGWARNCADLLMHGRPEERPDALFIVDDNLVEHAAAGLMDAGVKVPDELDVVAHCNFPWPMPSVVPVCRLGFDAREVMRQCIDLIDQQRRGEGHLHSKTISAVFESELSPTL